MSVRLHDWRDALVWAAVDALYDGADPAAVQRRLEGLFYRLSPRDRCALREAVLDRERDKAAR